MGGSKRDVGRRPERRGKPRGSGTPVWKILSVIVVLFVPLENHWLTGGQPKDVGGANVVCVISSPVMPARAVCQTVRPGQVFMPPPPQPQTRRDARHHHPATPAGR
jgi:hypothetical protein